MRKFNHDLLNRVIAERGFRKKHIAAKLGIAPPRLSEKLTGRVYMYPDELINVLMIINEDIDKYRLVDWYPIAEETSCN